MAKGSRGGKRASGVNTAKTEFTQGQQDALDYYVSGDGMVLNNYLRGRNGVTESDMDDYERNALKNLDGALNQNLTEQTLYRSVDASAVFGNMSDMDFSNLQDALVYGDVNKFNQGILNRANGSVGKTITDKGFVSTTRDSDIADNFGGFTGSDKPIVMKITTGKNTKGADISKATKGIIEAEKYDPQKETLLARNQKYKVTKVYSKNGNIYVDVTMN